MCLISLKYDYRTSVIRNPSGEVVFEMNNVEVPRQWSQIATDILAQKYFRKVGTPADGSVGRETSAKQVGARMANCWKYGASAIINFTSLDAQVFMKSWYTAYSTGLCANSPNRFNTGLHESYGITGKPQGHYFVDPVDSIFKEIHFCL